MSIATTPFASHIALRTLLKVSISCLLALSGGIFAFAEGGPIAAATIPIALGALLWNDIKGTFSLNVWMANGLGLIAFAIAGAEFFGESIEGRLLGFGHLLFYLSWILLWQEKGTPQIWWLCALSVLQVATSSVLTNSIWLGFFLIIYVLWALWTLSIFTLHRAVQRTTGTDSKGALSPAPIPSPSEGNSISRNGVRTASASRWITLRFVTGIMANGILSIIVGLAFFVLTPRVWVGSPLFIKNQVSAAVRSQTGFSEEVSVGDMGQILENHDLVLEATFSDSQSGDPIDVNEYASGLGLDAPLFRGTVLGEYDNGRWTAVSDRFRLVRPASRRILNRISPLVKQDIRLHSIGTQTLFACGPTVTCLPADKSSRYESEHELLGNTFRRQLKDSDDAETGEVFEYFAYSLSDHQRPYSMVHPSVERRYAQMMTRFPSGLEPLAELAKSTTQTAEGSTLPPNASVERLVTLLRDSGEYHYSLKLSIDDPNIDPVVDFVINRKEGHCEYFASALVLMLRSIGIPARYVNGFKGGTLNTKTGRIEVRQLHTHAWVEAYVDRRWIVLDPTPAARDEAVSAISETSHFWTDLTADIRSLWVSGMTLSGGQQRRMLFAPLKDSTGSILESLQSFADDWNSQGQGSGSVPGDARSRIIRIIISLVTFALLLFSAVWLWKHGPDPLRRRLRIRRSQTSIMAPTVPFYERFRKILAQRGHQRRESQTPQEFAVDLDQQLQSLHASRALNDILRTLTQAFYEVRFGHHDLSEQQLHELDASLDALERSLENGNSPNGR
ncbi:MAG: DUF3488 and transglutaminase-like domain-containing protein [Planctomycetaceae bacterium]